MQLSIITINYNNIEGLRRTINSILSQTWRQFEWIIVDGGSTDGSRELIEETAALPDSNITWWCSEKDKGVYNAMNKGIAHAQGQYLNFMNAGDYFCEPDTLQRVFEGKEYEADVVYGSHYRYDANGRVFIAAPDQVNISYILGFGFNHQRCFIKRELLSEESYDESYKIMSDSKHLIECLLKNCQFEMIDIPICCFEATGISSAQLELKRAEKVRLIKEVMPACLQQDCIYLMDNTAVDIYCPDIVELRRLLPLRRFNRRVIHLVIALLHLVERFYPTPQQNKQ
ncbi:MAG: glycosyltransferase family 2 protein [Bacteroidales bacterium]|nr:glycosyltransferase family 2 protein [Bacteroidales bacterium]